MASVFISGVSDGIGLALATLHLQKGDSVIGMARHCPEQIAGHDNFVLIQADFGCLTQLSEVIDTNFAALENAEFDTLYLNAGATGNSPEYAGNTSLNDVVTVMNINAIANKLLLDVLLNMKHKPALVVVSASIAGRRYRAGMLAYSMSKAALEALSGVYAQEYPDVFFAVLGMCNVDTRLSHNIVNHPNVSLFPDHVRLKQRFQIPGYVVSAEMRAEDIYKIVQEQNCKHLKNGEFIEVRTLLNSF
ncbi:SDR family NAD(P)-dependent oxidoreductase [Photobacterium lutimaris]|uniref:Short-chain dehydrogenase n=1 Tax=Photobacterium lutimaris TaxID=388278 RepID=A0A2T3IWN0_9GAMM|nr:SDR family NAD(P)-dependent oxidoreductase [Photobacterium lutimaris]PSU32895.1 short-chain dehydrogenase [Photobacterium lutimaris]TDR74119.1 short subunit dehydrogenase [Photobacterium lutimaris]